MAENPYPETIEDECSGVTVWNDKHIAWQEGYYAGCIDGAEEMSKLLVGEVKKATEVILKFKQKLIGLVFLNKN